MSIYRHMCKHKHKHMHRYEIYNMIILYMSFVKIRSLPEAANDVSQQQQEQDDGHQT